MTSSPKPYLKVTRRQSIQRGTSSTSSCSTFTHPTGPIPSGNTNVSGSLNGAVVNQPPILLPDHGRVQTFLDRRPDRERRRERVALDLDVRTVTDPHLVDLAEQLVGRVAREHVRRSRLDPDADERELPARSHTSADRELVVTELLPGELVGRVRMRSESDIAMSRYVAPTSSAPVKTGITNRGSAAFRIASQSFALAQSATCMASVASIDAAENLSPRS